VIKIQIISDPVCPWCYIGKRRLDAALAARPALQATLGWLPYQLSPETPREGRDRVAHYESIFGAERARVIMEQMTDTARGEGLDFQLKPGARSPNTLRAHALLYRAAGHPQADQSLVAEQLFAAHHEACEDIGDLEVLARIAGDAGMDAVIERDRLASGADEPAVQALIKQVQELGVNGVPFFIINDRYAFSGAQPSEAVTDLLDRVVRETGAG